MNQTIIVKANTVGKKILLEVDATKFEQLAAYFGFFSADFIKSIDTAEKEYKNGKVRVVSSLSQIRKST